MKTGRQNKLKFINQKSDTLQDLNRKTEFRTLLKDSAYEMKVENFLKGWQGTKRGLPTDWANKNA